LFVVRTPDRARLQSALESAGIGYGIHYPIPIHLQGAYRPLGHQPGDFPVAEDLAGRILSLPLFPEITVEEQERVVAAVRSGV
jgi:dTDP-4-amino-4,6-dideoxygalactose transaminase